jgi:hypothetical protein
MFHFLKTRADKAQSLQSISSVSMARSNRAIPCHARKIMQSLRPAHCSITSVAG